MPTLPMIDILILLEKTSGKEKIVYLYPDAPGDQAMELFVNTAGTTFVLYHQDAYYDDALRQRRNTNNMILSSTKERLLYVGSVWNNMPYDMKDYLLIGRTTLTSKNILIDEK